MEAFPKQAPAMTLRQGDALDSYRDEKELACEESDEPTDQYLEAYHWGIVYLDAVSWKNIGCRTHSTGNDNPLNLKTFRGSKTKRPSSRSVP